MLTITGVIIVSDMLISPLAGIPLPVQGPSPHAVAAHAARRRPSARLAPQFAADVASEQSRPHRRGTDELVVVPARRRSVPVSVHASQGRPATRPDVQVPPGGQKRYQPLGGHSTTGMCVWF